MRNPAKKILTVVLAIAIFLIPRYALPQEQPNGDQPKEIKQEKTESAPDLADIIPKATELSADLAILKKMNRLF